MKNAQFLNFNASYLEQLATAHVGCGYAEYIEKYLRFPPSGVQPAFSVAFNPTTAYDCDVWDSVYRNAYIPVGFPSAKRFSCC